MMSSGKAAIFIFLNIQNQIEVTSHYSVLTIEVR